MPKPTQLDQLTPYEKRIRRMMTSRTYSKTLTITVGGYMDGLPANERRELRELDTLALDFDWHVRFDSACYSRNGRRRTAAERRRHGRVYAPVAPRPMYNRGK